MDPFFILLIFSICLLAIAFAGQLWRRELLRRHAHRIFWLAVFSLLILVTYYTHAQFLAWKNAPPPAAYLVPPYQPITYVLFYSFTRYWATYVISFGIALLVAFGARWLNKRKGERFFYPEEPWLIALSILLVGHPLWVGYLALVLFAYLLYVSVLSIVRRKFIRISFYYFWLPVALVLLAVLPLLRQHPLWALLKI